MDSLIAFGSSLAADAPPVRRAWARGVGVIILFVALLGVLVAGAGVFVRSWWLLVLATVLACPFVLYLAALPSIRGVAFVLLFLPASAAVLVKSKRPIAGGLVAIFAIGLLASEAFLFGAFR